VQQAMFELELEWDLKSQLRESEMKKNEQVS
jgi:hypothetical protein